MFEEFCGAYISEKGLLTIASAAKIALVLLIDFFLIGPIQGIVIKKTV